MKNRTIIGLICIVVAVVTTFLVAPFANRLTSDTVETVRLKVDVAKGSVIGEEQIEKVKVNRSALPEGTVTSSKEVVGKYATSTLYAGDYLTENKLKGEPNTAEDVFATLDGSKVAVSVTIDSFAAGLSGKLQNGDIISLIVTDKEGTEAVIPVELTYLKVITTTTSGGIDKDKIVENEDGSYELPSTVTVLVNTEQAKLLSMYEGTVTMQAALVYRGDKATAEKFLAKQDAVFAGTGGDTDE